MSKSTSPLITAWGRCVILPPITFTTSVHGRPRRRSGYWRSRGRRSRPCLPGPGARGDRKCSCPHFGSSHACSPFEPLSTSAQVFRQVARIERRAEAATTALFGIVAARVRTNRAFDSAPQARSSTSTSDNGSKGAVDIPLDGPFAPALADRHVGVVWTEISLLGVFGLQTVAGEGQTTTWAPRAFFRSNLSSARTASSFASAPSNSTTR